MDAVRDSLSGKVALVTGAGSGIGAATARLFAASGADVGLLGNVESDVEATADALRQEGHTPLKLIADVANAAQMETAVAQIADRFGRLDIVVANAGINGTWAPVEEISEAEWEQTLAVNLKGTFLTVKFAVPWLKKQGGSIVVVSSVNGTRMFSTAGASAYAASKAGQVAFAKMIALELAPAGIRVNAVCPGSTATRIGTSTQKRNVEKVRPAITFPNGFVPLSHGKLADAAQVAETIWYLASPLSSHVTGAELFVDGGESLLKG